MFGGRKKVLFPRKILERVYIKENKGRCMNLNEGIGVNAIYMEEERIFG